MSRTVDSQVDLEASLQVLTIPAKHNLYENPPDHLPAWDSEDPGRLQYKTDWLWSTVWIGLI